LGQILRVSVACCVDQEKRGSSLDQLADSHGLLGGSPYTPILSSMIEVVWQL